MAETVVGAALIESGRVLLGLRAAHKSFAGCWDLIGGHVESGEAQWTALCRELTEEVGIQALEGNFLKTLTLAVAGRQAATLHVYSVTRWRGEPAIANNEHTAIRWFGLEEAERLSNLAASQYRDLFASLRKPGSS